MNPKNLLYLIFTFLLFSLQGCDQDEKTNKPKVPSQEEFAFKTFCDSIQTIELPFSINENDLQYLSHSAYMKLEDSIALKYIGPIVKGTHYFAVAKHIISDSAVVLLLLESSLDTMFNASEIFSLQSFSREGREIHKILFAASVVNQQHTKTTGTWYADMNIATQTFHYLFEKGAWTKPELPEVSAYFHLDTLGNFSLLHTDTTQHVVP